MLRSTFRVLCVRVLCVGVLCVAAVGVCVTGTAAAYTLTAGRTSGTLEIAASTEPQNEVVVTATVNGANISFTPVADDTPSGCRSANDATSCPTTDVSTELEITTGYDVSISGLQTQTLEITGSNADDQFNLSSVTLGTLEIDPGSGDDALDATGTIASMKLDNKATEGGTMSMNLATGATTGTLDLAAGDNYIYAPQSMLNIDGAGGDSTITAGGSIDAGGGNDLIHAVSTTQTINGGNVNGGAGGDSSLDFLAVATPLTLTMVNGGASVLIGNETTAHITNIVSLTGSSGGDTMIAQGDGADVLTGGPGNNTFIPNGGPDVINGGPGSDNTIDYADVPASTGLTIDLANGLGGPTGGVPATQDQLTNIQSAIGNDGTDVVTAGNSGGTFVLGNGNDTFTGGAGNDDVTAGNGNDLLTGGDGNDTFVVGNGTDTLTGGDGDNYMQSGTGTDMFVAGWGANTIIGGGGDDTVSYANRGPGQGVTVTLSGSGASTGNGQPGENDSLTGIDNVIGGGGYNILTGDGASNVLTGGSGGNEITGGSGTDTLIGGSGNDIINSGSGGNTTIEGNGGADQINATSGNGDHISCGTGDSVVEINATDTTDSNCATVTNPSATTTTTTAACTYVIPGQVCDGKAAPYPLVTSEIRDDFNFEGEDTIVATLTPVDLPQDSGLSITCTTPALHGCPFRSYVKNYSAAKASVALAPLFKKHPLPVGTKLTIRITAQLAVGRYVTLRMRSHHLLPAVVEECISPITGKVITCPADGYLPAPG